MEQEVIEEMDAFQQAMYDATVAGITRFDPNRFPEKSYYWLRKYQEELAKYAEVI